MYNYPGINSNRVGLSLGLKVMRVPSVTTEGVRAGHMLVRLPDIQLKHNVNEPTLWPRSIPPVNEALPTP